MRVARGTDGTKKMARLVAHIARGAGAAFLEPASGIEAGLANPRRFVDLMLGVCTGSARTDSGPSWDEGTGLFYSCAMNPSVAPSIRYRQGASTVLSGWLAVESGHSYGQFVREIDGQTVR